MVTATRSVSFSVGVVGIAGATPTLGYLAGGINNDNRLFLLANATLLAWLQFLHNRSRVWLWILCLCLGLGCVTKYTFLPMFALLGCSALYAAHRYGMSASKLVAPVLTATALPLALWLGRNLLTTGQLVPLAPVGQDGNLSELSFFGFLQRFEVFGSFYHHFIAFIGNYSSAAGENSHLRATGATLLPYTLFLLISAALAWFATSSHLVQRRGWFVALVWMTATLSLAALIASRDWLSEEYVMLPVALGLMAAFLLAAPWMGFSKPAPDSATGDDWHEQALAMAVPVSQLSLVLFVSILLWQVYGFTVSEGQLSGAQGRYLIPLIGLFAIGFLYLGWRVFARHRRWFPALVLVFVLNETHFWLTDGLNFIVGR